MECESSNITSAIKKGNRKMEKKRPACFKAYDIRGRVPDELNNGLAYDIGRAYASVFSVKKVVIGHDIRLSSPELAGAVIEGLVDCGVDVIDIGLCGTEEIYHAAFSLESEGVDGGIMITASHNPADYNGMKLVCKGARPVSGDSGLFAIADMIAHKRCPSASADKGGRSTLSLKENYIEHLLGYVRPAELKPLKIVVNSGNGCAGPVIDLLENRLPFRFVKLHHRPDGNFPNGVPNPLLPDKREETARMVREQGADLGIAWDGDFDRCFFWDESGNFIEGYYLVGLLATELLKKEPGAKILHDPRLIWNTREMVAAAGGVPIATKTGHAFIKERMRQENALYGGEMSAHHYFRDFGYCDSGMIPWLLVCSLLSRSGMCLSELVSDRIAAFPVSGEINNKVAQPDGVIARVKAAYADGEMDFIDGLSVAFPRYRFNMRKSNTESLLRLNVETRGDKNLLQEKTREILEMIKQ
jgi:phosphomannomutase